MVIDKNLVFAFREISSKKEWFPHLKYQTNPLPSPFILILQSHINAVSNPLRCRVHHRPSQEIAISFVGHRQHHLRRASSRVTLLFFSNTFRFEIPQHHLLFSNIAQSDTALFLAPPHAPQSHNSSWCFLPVRRHQSNTASSRRHLSL